MRKKDICFIRPRLRGNDYWHDAIKSQGYRTVIPYKDYNLLFRIIREVWFWLGLPKKPWFNKDIKKISADVYFIKDPLMTAEYINWLRELKPEARLILDYDNRADVSLNPNEIRDRSVEKWSYDPDDCKKYGMKLKPPCYLDYYQIPAHKRDVKKKYDVVYVGRDKGRAHFLFSLEKKLKKMGLRTCFRISPTRSFYKFKDRRYCPVIPYTEYLELVNESRAILNIMPKGQKSLTMRDFEAVFNNIKCITNNRAVMDFELYDPSRYFVINRDNLDEIVSFLQKDFKAVKKEELEEIKIDRVIYKMLNDRS